MLPIEIERLERSFGPTVVGELVGRPLEEYPMSVLRDYHTALRAWPRGRSKRAKIKWIKEAQERVLSSCSDRVIGSKAEF